MARNPVRHRGINTGLNRPGERVWTPKRMISDPDVIETLSLPDPEFALGEQTDSTLGWVVEDGAAASSVVFGTNTVTIPEFARIYTTVPGLKADTHYRVSCSSAGTALANATVILGGTLRPRMESTGTFREQFFATPEELFDVYISFQAVASGLTLTGPIVVEQWSDVVSYDDNEWKTSNVTVSPDLTGDWIAPRAGTGAFAGLPSMTGDGTIHMCTGDDVPDTSSGVFKDDFIVDHKRVVPQRPYKIAWASTVLGTPGAFWELAFLMVSDAFDLDGLTTESEVTGYSHAGSTPASTRKITLAREATSSIDSTVDLTGPLTVTRGSYPAPDYDLTIANDAHDGHDEAGPGWVSTGNFKVHGWVPAPFTTAGLSFENVLFTNTDKVWRAYLIVEVVTEAVSGLFFAGHEIPSATSSATPWSATHLPAFDGTFVSQTSTTGLGVKVFDVSTIVVDIIGNANWNSGDFVNLSLVAAQADMDITFRNQNARLVIYGSEGVF